MSILDEQDKIDGFFQVWELLNYGEDSPLSDLDRELWIKAFKVGVKMARVETTHMAN
jgi:hypothetical protein